MHLQNGVQRTIDIYDDAGRRVVARQTYANGWNHTTTEFDDDGNGTFERRVEYRIPFGIIGRLAHGLFVVRTLKYIFDYRAETTARLLGTQSDEPNSGRPGRRERPGLVDRRGEGGGR